MNIVADCFERLVSNVRQHPESLEVNIHAADLAAHLAQLPEGFACVALVSHKNRSRFVGLEHSASVLAPYGVTLRRRTLQNQHGRGVLVFAELTELAPSPFAGAVALEQPRPALELAA